MLLRRLREHERLELLATERPLTKEYRLIEVGLQGNGARFERNFRALMALLVIVIIERKTLGGIRTSVFVPSVREDHAPNIPKDCGDVRHEQHVSAGLQ